MEKAAAQTRWASGDLRPTADKSNHLAMGNLSYPTVAAETRIATLYLDYGIDSLF